MNDRYHRLDGPAKESFNSEYCLQNSYWYVDGIELEYLGHYIDNKKDIFNYFKYCVTECPDLVEPLMQLINHNHWLNENEILLLKMSEMFL
jgi:hypothetical protein